jgi:hypothetical protein
MAQVNNINLTHLGDGLKTPQLQPREPFSPKKDYESFIHDSIPQQDETSIHLESPSKKRMENVLKSPKVVDAAQVYRRIR